MRIGEEFSEEELLAGLAEAVLKLEVERAGELSQIVLDRGFSARRAILEGLSEGMRRVGDRFCSHEYFVPEVLVAARAMYRGFNLLKPRMLVEGTESTVLAKSRVTIAVVEGDLHDIGKNIVKLLLEAEGFEVTDLGKNVPLEALMEHLQKQATDMPPILALSTLMTSTLSSMEKAVTATKDAIPGIKIMVGGAPVTEHFAGEIGAAGTAAEATGAVKLALRLARPA